MTASSALLATMSASIAAGIVPAIGTYTPSGMIVEASRVAEPALRIADEILTRIETGSYDAPVAHNGVTP
jgi:hypothetical protein